MDIRHLAPENLDCKTTLDEIRHAAERLRHGLPADRLRPTVAGILGPGISISTLEPARYASVLLDLRVALAAYLATIGPIFPLGPDSKFPLKGSHGHLDASQDMKTIRAWAEKVPNCNWGITTNAVDVDTKPPKEGSGRTRTGVKTWEWLLMEYGSGDDPDTLMAGTPTGGTHVYVLDTLPNGGNTLGDGVDTRGAGLGYVVAAGSHTKKGFYFWRNNLSIASLPWLATVLGTVQTFRGERGLPPVVEVDTTEAIAAAVDLLQSYASSPMKRNAKGKQTNGVAIQGEHGDEWTVQVAMNVGDLGIGADMCLALMDEHFNPLCTPPWGSDMDGAISDRLSQKVRSAYRSRQTPPGTKSPLHQFSDDASSYVDTKEPSKQLKKENAAREKDKQANEKRKGEQVERVWTYREVCGEYVYVAGIDRFICRANPEHIIKTDVANKMWGYLVLKGDKCFTHRVFRDEPDERSMRRLNRVVFQPGDGEIIDGNYNMWRKSPIEPSPGDTTLWNAHLEYLFPDATAREMVLDWIAWVLQNPSEKPKHALLIAGKKQGTGKTWIFDVMGRIIGLANVSPVSSVELSSSFNKWAVGCKLVVIEELRSLDKREITHKLHPIITQEAIPVNDKGVPQYKIDNCFAVGAMTNVDDAILVDNTDRRWEVHRTFSEPREAAYYDRLYAVLKDPVALGAIAHELLNRDLKGYSGKHRARETEAKLALIDAGTSEIGQWMADHDGTSPLTLRVVTLDEVEEMLPKHYRARPGMRAAVKETLRNRFRGEPWPHQIQPSGRNGPKLRVWVLGDTPENVQAAYKEDHPDNATGVAADFQVGDADD
jgi:Bifunctional DNA primase/polymerase, N-terminal/Family of unknown function (DUF5906)